MLDLGAGTGKLTAALARHAGQVAAVEPDLAMLARLRRQLPGIPATAGQAEQAEFGHRQERTAGSLVATVATHSALLLMAEAERDRVLAAIRGYLATQPETSAGAFRLPLVTCAMRAVRAS